MNEEQQVIDAEATETAVAVPEKAPQPLAVVPREAQAITPAQAKVDAVANLTFKAYERASTLQLSDTELKALQADFPDDAFRIGAGGDANLIYIEHASLRERLNSVFGPGQWSIIPRNRWNEEYKTATGKAAVRVYVEAMLLVRGCFVAEAVGDMSYFLANEKTNYGDCVEGAKSAALRRCAKELGIGLQAWKKNFCEGWKARQRQPQQSAPTQQPAAQRPSPTQGDDVPMDFPKGGNPKPSEPGKKPARATAETRKWMIEQLADYPVEQVFGYARATAILLPTEKLTDWPLDKVPTSKTALKELQSAIEAFGKVAEPKPDKKPVDLTGKTSVRGVITKVEYKAGDTNGKKWVLFTITLKQGEQNEGKYNTFSRSLAEEAEEYSEKQTIVDLFYDGGEKGNTALAIVMPEVVP